MTNATKLSADNWSVELWTVRDFLEKSQTIDCNPVGQRPSVSPNPIGETKPSKQQSIIDTMMSGGDIGEIKIVRENGRYSFESIDGGNRKRTILEYMRNNFPLHKSSVLGEVKASELSDDIREKFMNYKLRIVTYDRLTTRQKGELFRDTNNTTPVNAQETLNSYGDIPIANLIRETARSISGYDSLPHELFTCHKTPLGNVIYPNVATNNTRLRLDEIVARITYMIYAGEKPVVAPFDALQAMYDDASLTQKEVNKIAKKLKAVLDFILKCSVWRRDQVSRGLLQGQIVMLYRLYFHFKSEYGSVKVENFEAFYDEFSKAYNAFNASNPKFPKRIVENNRLIHEAFNQHLGEHKTQFKFDNTVTWILEGMDLDRASLVVLDSKRVFAREMVELKLAEQGFKCWVTGEKLTMKDAQGGHIVAHSQGGKTEYSNLVVISAEHNRRMQDTNANDYKKSVLLEDVA